MSVALDDLAGGLQRRLLEIEPRPVKGRLTRVVGTLIHASIPEARLGELCLLRDPASGTTLAAEIIGFDGETALLTPIGDMYGVSTITEVAVEFELALPAASVSVAVTLNVPSPCAAIVARDTVTVALLPEMSPARSV